MSIAVDSVSLTVRRSDGELAGAPWPYTDIERMESLVPWRTFRWYYGQKHYSGFYWSSTMRAHVIYESRLELTRLIYADFSPEVRSIHAQPFLITAEIDKVQRRHVPDFLLLRDDSVPMVVDVKPRELLIRPKVSFSLGWAREVVESWGWEYQVWCEPPHYERANLRFLAGYRHASLFRPELLQEIRTADLDGVTLGDAFRSFPNWPKEPSLWGWQPHHQPPLPSAVRCCRQPDPAPPLRPAKPLP